MSVMTLADPVRLQIEVEQFLYSEAAMLEDRQFSEWLALTTDDIIYAMPVRLNRMLRDQDHQFLPLSRGGHFNDNKHTLTARVRKLNDHKSWSENPPSATRIMLTNVRVKQTDTPDQYLALSNFLFTRVRLGHVYTPISGRREDLVRRADTPLGFKLARRMIYIDHAALPGSGLTTLI